MTIGKIGSRGWIRMENAKKKFKFFKKYSKFEKKNFLFVYLLILIPVAQFAVFWVYVNISSICLAFQDSNGAFTFSNFAEVFRVLVDQDSWGFNLAQMIGKSVLLWSAVNVVAFPISIFTCYMLFKYTKGHLFFRICFLIPSLVGAVVWTTLIRYMVAHNGPITELLRIMHVQLPEMALRNGLFVSDATAYPTIVVVTFLMSIVGNNVVLTGAYARIPEELFESAQIDGANLWREVFNIAVPCVWPTIATLLTFSFCSVLTYDNGTYVYSQGEGWYGMANVGFYFQYLTYKISSSPGQSYNYPSAVGMFITVISVPIALIARRILEKVVEPTDF